MFVAIYFRDVVVKQTRAFAGVAHPVKFARLTNPSDQRAAQQSLEIKRGVGSQLPGFSQPRHQTSRHSESAELAAWKNMDVVDAFVPAQNWRPLRVDDPGNLSVGIRLTNRCDRRQRVHDVAE